MALKIDAPLVCPLEDDPDEARWWGLYSPLRSRADDSDDWLPKRPRGVSDDVKAFLGDVQAVAAVDDPRDATAWKLQELSNADKPRVPSIAVPSLYQTDPLTMKTRYSRVSFEVNELAH